MSLGLRPGWFGIIVGWFGVVWGGGRPTAGRGHPKTIPKPSHKPSQNHPQTTAPTHHPPLDNCKYDSVLYGFVPTVSKPDAQYIYIYIYIYCKYPYSLARADKSTPGHLTDPSQASQGPKKQRPGQLYSGPAQCHC